MVPNLLAPGRDGPSAPALALLPECKRTGRLSCCRLLSVFRLDTVRGQGTVRRIQSSANSESIEPRLELGFSRLLCPFGHSGKKATAVKPSVLSAAQTDWLMQLGWRRGDRFDGDTRDAAAHHVEFRRAARRHIDQQVAAHRAAIVDRGDDRASIS
jgi:hypothetical protein